MTKSVRSFALLWKPPQKHNTLTSRMSGVREFFSTRATFTVMKHRRQVTYYQKWFAFESNRKVEKLTNLFNSVFTGINFSITQYLCKQWTCLGYCGVFLFFIFIYLYIYIFFIFYLYIGLYLNKTADVHFVSRTDICMDDFAFICLSKSFI